MGRLIISSEVADVADPYPDVDMLRLEPVPVLRELLDVDPPIDEPDVDPATPVPMREPLEDPDAMGAETLLAWVELGSGRASVIGWF